MNESTKPANDSNSGDSGTLPTTGPIGEARLPQVLTHRGLRDPSAPNDEGDARPVPPEPSDIVVSSTPTISFSAPNRRNRSDDNCRQNGVGGALTPRPKPLRALSRNSSALIFTRQRLPIHRIEPPRRHIVRRLVRNPTKAEDAVLGLSRGPVPRRVGCPGQRAQRQPLVGLAAVVDDVKGVEQHVAPVFSQA